MKGRNCRYYKAVGILIAALAIVNKNTIVYVNDCPFLVLSCCDFAMDR